MAARAHRQRQSTNPIDYAWALGLLNERFASIQKDSVGGVLRPRVGAVSADLDSIFATTDQGYRECLVGCILARLSNRGIDVHLPYVNHGPTAFNARTLDKEAVNPFLKRGRIPSSTGPYLTMFRRSVRFDQATGEGVRNPEVYDAFLRCLDYVMGLDADAELHSLLDDVLSRFLVLRDAAQIPIARIRRLSVRQYGPLIDRLLATPSGGRYPMFLVIAMFQAILSRTALPWTVEWQGINVADAPSGAIGDVTVLDGEEIVIAAEVTERMVDRERLLRTFQDKISEAGVRDYLFFATADDGAIALADQYFAQGHEVNFVSLPNWLQQHLVTLLAEGRETFNAKLESLIARDDTPTALKIAWNEHVNAIAAGQ